MGFRPEDFGCWRCPRDSYSLALPYLCRILQLHYIKAPCLFSSIITFTEAPPLQVSGAHILLLRPHLPRVPPGCRCRDCLPARPSFHGSVRPSVLLSQSLVSRLQAPPVPDSVLCSVPCISSRRRISSDRRCFFPCRRFSWTCCSRRRQSWRLRATLSPLRLAPCFGW